MKRHAVDAHANNPAARWAKACNIAVPGQSGGSISEVLLNEFHHSAVKEGRKYLGYCGSVVMSVLRENVRPINECGPDIMFGPAGDDNPNEGGELNGLCSQNVSQNSVIFSVPTLI